MDLSAIVSVVQATIVPVVMISGSGLICMVIQTRYGRVVNSIRQLIQEQRRFQQHDSLKGLESDDADLRLERLKNLDAQILLLLKRGSKLRWALFLTFSSIVSFICTSFLILLSYVFGLAIVITLVALAFFFGMFFLLVGAVITVNEIANSYDAVSKEVKFARFELQAIHPDLKHR
jgi:VIT1/CCC1 family predicted Fe2+/Mn2+ transporter